MNNLFLKKLHYNWNLL